tara:strand:- start:419 stop:700 length:282 start_codon:yes stop_codon:yes gene_type:complete
MQSKINDMNAIAQLTQQINEKSEGLKALHPSELEEFHFTELIHALEILQKYHEDDLEKCMDIEHRIHSLQEMLDCLQSEEDGPSPEDLYHPAY